MYISTNKKKILKIEGQFLRNKKLSEERNFNSHNSRNKVADFMAFYGFNTGYSKLYKVIPEPTARSAVPGVSPGRGLLIPHGYLHAGKGEHSEVQSSSMIAGASLWFMGGPPH